MAEPKTRVLLVEDNAADARLLRELLSEVPRRPFELTVVGTLASAVDAVAGHHVVLLDLSLPDAQGAATVTRMVQAAGPAPVVVLTGTSDDEVALQALVLGADDYLRKAEITPSLLARTILYAIERRRGIENARRLFALEVARAESARTAERARMLADLSDTFAATLDIDEVALALCRCLVPRLVEGCLVDVVDEGGQVRRAAAHGASDELARWLSELGSLDLRLATSPGARAMDERCAVEVHDVAALAPAGAQAPGPLSALALPLAARGRPVGALTLLAGPASPLKDQRGLLEEVARRTAVALDNVLLHRATRRALSARDEVLAVVSHDLRSPLSVLSLALQVIGVAAEGGALPPPGVLDKGRRAVSRMERLLSDLLDVARIDAGTLAVTKQRVDVVPVLRDAIEQSAALAAQKQIALDASLPPLARVEADRDRLMQLLANLLGNAIKFTPNGGSVTVSGALCGAHFEVSVSDTGPGVPPESRPHVFDRFYQSERRRDGVGLGLAIAKGIVDAHGGSIGVESAPGGGARFWFRLPVGALADEANT